MRAWSPARSQGSSRCGNDPASAPNEPRAAAERAAAAKIAIAAPAHRGGHPDAGAGRLGCKARAVSAIERQSFTDDPSYDGLMSICANRRDPSPRGTERPGRRTERALIGGPGNGGVARQARGEVRARPLKSSPARERDCAADRRSARCGRAWLPSRDGRRYRRPDLRRAAHALRSTLGTAIAYASLN